METNNENNRQNQQKYRTSNTITTTDDGSAKHQDSLTITKIETSKKNFTQEQNLTTRESQTSKCCDKNDDDSTKGCLDFNAEMIGEKRSRPLEHRDCTKCSSKNVNIIIENMEKSPTMSTTNLTESEESAESLEKVVLSACFSENVRKAFVALSEDFNNPQQDAKSTTNNTGIDTEPTDRERPVGKESDFIQRVSESEKTDENVHSHDFVNDNASNKDVSTERTDNKEQPLQENSKLSNPTQCCSENERTDENRHTEAFCDPVEDNEIGSIETNDLDPVKNVTEDAQAIKQELSFTGCLPENNEIKFDSNSEDFGKNIEGTEMENRLDEAYEDAGKHGTDFINFKDGLECLSNTIENKIDMLEDVADKHSFDEDSTCTEYCSLKEKTSSTNKNELDIIQNARHNETTLNEDYVFTGCYQEKRKVDFVKQSTDFIELKNNLVSSSTRNKNEMIPDIDVQEKEQGCCLERDETSCRKHSTNVIDLRKDLLMTSSTDDSGWEMDRNVSDKNEPSDDESTFIQCCTPEYDRERIVVISHEDRTNADMFVIEQENVNECLFDANEDPMFTECCSGSGNTEMKETNEDMCRILYKDQETAPDHENAPVQDSTLYEIVSSSRNEQELMREDVLDDKKHLDEETTFSEVSEIQEINGNMHESFNIEQENETIDECLFFDICKDNLLYETGSIDSDKENDESLSADSCEDSSLYEIVSLPIRSENELYMDKHCFNDRLSLNKDSAFPGRCSEHEGTEMQKINQDINESSNLDKETESVDKSLFQKSDQCLSNFCKESTSYETLSYCKIDRDESCDCFEEVDMDCCCQCCECIGNHD